VNLFNHHFMDLSGARIYLERYRNQPFFIVNIATESRFVPQLKRLQQLHTQFSRHGLVIIAIPCNDFDEEPREEAQIDEFMRENYPSSFIVTQRYAVTGPEAHPLFRELLQEKGAAALPRGTFNKYLFDRRGELAEQFPPETLPDDPMLIRSINQQLGGV
jgi:glutathione peroxidase